MAGKSSVSFDESHLELSQKESMLLHEQLEQSMAEIEEYCSLPESPDTGLGSLSSPISTVSTFESTANSTGSTTDSNLSLDDSIDTGYGSVSSCNVASTKSILRATKSTPGTVKSTSNSTGRSISSNSGIGVLVQDSISMGLCNWFSTPQSTNTSKSATSRSTSKSSTSSRPSIGTLGATSLMIGAASTGCNFIMDDDDVSETSSIPPTPGSTVEGTLEDLVVETVEDLILEQEYDPRDMDIASNLMSQVMAGM